MLEKVEEILEGDGEREEVEERRERVDGKVRFRGRLTRLKKGLGDLFETFFYGGNELLTEVTSDIVNSTNLSLNFSSSLIFLIYSSTSTSPVMPCKYSFIFKGE